MYGRNNMRRWLHISDLHFNDTAMSTEYLREKLPEFLKREQLSCDYVFCTGDIRTANAENNCFSDKMAEYLKQLCNAVGVEEKNLFIVPGNHDVDRGAPGRDEAIRRICFHRNGYYNSAVGIIKDEDLRDIAKGQTDFRCFLHKIYGEDRMHYYTDDLHPHFTIETPDFNILHIDSTLTYTADQEATDLIIGTKLLQEAISEINPDKPTILLSHYPVTALLQDEYKYVRELLRDKEITVWLSGHQHDHLVQPVGYLHSLQAGELRYESNTNATVLICEFDEVTLQCTVKAYTWFPEGWSKYPILWHDAQKKCEYPFRFKKGNIQNTSCETLKARKANEIYLNRLTLIKSLLPKVKNQRDKSLGSILQGAWASETPHLILLADGGMGKTTTLLHLCKTSNQTVLYIPAERLSAMKSGIKQYCSNALFDGNERKFEDFCRNKYNTPNLILLIDGLNEIDAKEEREFINELKSFQFLKGLQIVISSRSDFTDRYSMEEYRCIELVPLKDEQIKNLFSEKEWLNIKGTFTLHGLVQNPMMVTMYKEICPIIEQYKDEECLDWVLPIKNATDLLHNYYVAQIALMLTRDGLDSKKIQKAYITLFTILPALAYLFESSFSMQKGTNECRKLIEKILNNTENNEEIYALQERVRDYDLPELKMGEVIDYLTVETHLLYKDAYGMAFSHQIFRDYLSAAWIARQEDIKQYWNQRKIPFPVMEHIRNMSGKYWEGLATKVHDACRGCKDVSVLIGNMIDCFPYSETGGIPDYSQLDLRGILLPNVDANLPDKISLSESLIDEMSIGFSSNDSGLYRYLTFSEDNTYLAAVSKNRIIIFSVHTDEMPFIYALDKGVLRLSFIQEYLFVTSKGPEHCLYVFQHKDNWKYNGMIRYPQKYHHDLFRENFRRMILNEDDLYVYYNNRLLVFSLETTRLLSNQNIHHAWENCIEGQDISFIREIVKYKKDISFGILCQTKNADFTATSKIDGGLVIQKGNEVYRILKKGITVLKDGAISGDGKRAVTLSYETKDEKRMIQIWDLDRKIRMGNMSCPSTIEKIYLSNDGSFIFGETETQTWVYSLLNNTSEIFEEHFVSNQIHKMATLDNKVLRKNKKYGVYLYDLKTRKILETNIAEENVKLACFMPNGSVATVKANSRKVKFQNIRDGLDTEVNSQGARITGVCCFKEKPFIAVATADNVISIYHTGDGMRKHILNPANNKMMIVGAEKTVIACSNGQGKLETYNYWEHDYNGKNRGRWYCNRYSEQDFPINGNVLDLSFNTENHELVVILSNGQIMRCHELYCRFHGVTKIITNFNVDSYDFRKCKCNPVIREQILQNGGLIA